MLGKDYQRESLLSSMQIALWLKIERNQPFHFLISFALFLFLPHLCKCLDKATREQLVDGSKARPEVTLFYAFLVIFSLYLHFQKPFVGEGTDLKRKTLKYLGFPFLLKAVYSCLAGKGLT